MKAAVATYVSDPKKKEQKRTKSIQKRNRTATNGKTSTTQQNWELHISKVTQTAPRPHHICLMQRP